MPDNEIIYYFGGDTGGFDKAADHVEKKAAEVANKTKDLTNKNKRFADEGERKVVPFIRKYRWALSLLLITQNAVYRLAQGTKVLAAMMNLLTKAIGFVIDMALIPFIPLIILAAVWLFKFGEWLNALPDPIQKVVTLVLILAAAFLYFGASAIGASLAGLSESLIAIGVSAATADFFVLALGRSIAGLAGLGIGIAIVFLLDETGIMDRVKNLGAAFMDFFGGLGYEVGKRFFGPFVEWFSRQMELLQEHLPSWAKPLLSGFTGFRQTTTADNMANPYWSQYSKDAGGVLRGSEAMGGNRYTTSGALSNMFSGGQNLPPVSGTAPQSTLTNTNTTNQPITVNNMNITMNGVNDPEKFVKETQAAMFKGLGRNVTSVR